MKRNIMLKIGYCGTAYCGWQRQENAITVQQRVEETLSELCKHKVTVYGCSRTDSGVHAKDFALNFHTENPIPCDRLPIALNALLPEDIVCRSANEMPDDFHARFACKGKTYLYRIWTAAQREPLEYRRSYHYPYALDLQAMREMAKSLEGRRDFAAFAAAGSTVKSTVRTLYRIQVEQNGPLVEILVKGDGFLYNMVRIITGTLLLAGRNTLSIQTVAAALERGDRTAVGPTVPAYGLYLNEVYYDAAELTGGECHE